MQLERLPNDEITLLELATWLHKEWLYKNPANTIESVVEMLRERAERDTPPLTVIAREEGGSLAGTASLTERDLNGRDFGPWLSGLYVSMLHREKGIGELLCEQIHAEARTLGYKEIFLFTRQHPSLLEFYERLGYQVISKERYASEDILIMKLML